MPEEDSKTIKNLESKDYTTCGMVLSHEARRWIGIGDLQRAEECLTIQQHMLIMAGAYDIGQLSTARDLPQNVFKEDIAKQREINKLHDEINELKQEIERSKADLEPVSLKERLTNIFK